MKSYIKKVITKGDPNGNGMIVKFRLPSGLEIIGIPTKNFYGGHWDLGPTWNYVVLADSPFLVDCGRFGQGKKLVNMMASVGIKAQNLDFVMISHGHEDHDGGLAELVKATDLKVKAHSIYDLMIRRYPVQAPVGYKENFPAKCWHCPMPESFFTKNCLGYHQVLQEIKVDGIKGYENEIGKSVKTYHLPGHSPDCLAVLVGTEVLIVGDIILPDISPWPTREAMFDEVAEVIKPYFPDPEAVFGLNRYLKSLKKLAEIARQHPQLLVLPAHRLYYKNQWNGIHLRNKVDELIQHHIQRCGAILGILRSGSKTAEEIAHEHFDERLLEGFGSLMAANEVVSHCEVLMKCGDVMANSDKKFTLTGNTNFEVYIENLLPD